MFDNVLFLILARSGSKSIPNKNIKLLDGKPLLAYRIEQALTLTKKENVWLSTDSMIYAEIGKKFGATIPYIRPKELATDTTSSSEVILNIIEYCEKNGMKYDAIALLEPTSPFVSNNFLSLAINKLFKTKDANAIVSTRIIHTNTIFIQENNTYLTELFNKLKNVKNIRRQDQKTQITPSGGFYISKWESYKINKSFYTEKTLSYLLPDSMALEIDNPIDFLWAEFLSKKNKKIKK